MKYWRRCKAHDYREQKVVGLDHDIERPAGGRENFWAWGMKFLYRRAGISLEDIGKIFNITRQAASYHVHKLRRW